MIVIIGRGEIYPPLVLQGNSNTPKVHKPPLLNCFLLAYGEYPPLAGRLPAPKAVYLFKKTFYNYLKLMRIRQATLFYPACAWCE